MNKGEQKAETDGASSESLTTKPQPIEWIVVLFVGAFAIAVLIACWVLVGNALRIGPP